MNERKPIDAAIKSAISRTTHRMEFDGFDATRRQKFAGIVNNLDGLCHLSESYYTGITHIIAEKLRRSEMILAAIAAGVPVVTVQYVYASQAAGKWLNAENFLFDPHTPGMTEFERKIAYAVQRSINRSNNGQEKPMKDWQFVLFCAAAASSSNLDHSIERGKIRRVIKAGGGRAVSNCSIAQIRNEIFPPYLNTIFVDDLISVFSTFRAIGNLRREGIRILPMDFIWDYLIDYPTPDPSDASQRFVDDYAKLNMDQVRLLPTESLPGPCQPKFRGAVNRQKPVEVIDLTRDDAKTILIDLTEDPSPVQRAIPASAAAILPTTSAIKAELEPKIEIETPVVLAKIEPMECDADAPENDSLEPHGPPITPICERSKSSASPQFSGFEAETYDDASLRPCSSEQSSNMIQNANEKAIDPSEDWRNGNLDALRKALESLDPAFRECISEVPYPCGYGSLQKYEKPEMDVPQRAMTRFPASFEGAFEFFGEVMDDDDEENNIHDHEQLLFDCLLELHSWFVAMPTASLQEGTVRVLWGLLKESFSQNQLKGLINTALIESLIRCKPDSEKHRELWLSVFAPTPSCKGAHTADLLLDLLKSISEPNGDQSLPALYRLEFLTLALVFDFRIFKSRRRRENNDEWFEKRFPNNIKQCPMIAQLIWYGKRDHFGKLQHPLTDLLRLITSNLEPATEENWIRTSCCSTLLGLCVECWRLADDASPLDLHESPRSVGMHENVIVRQCREHFEARSLAEDYFQDSSANIVRNLQPKWFRDQLKSSMRS